ncbi:MAG: transposase, partial [Chitinispirillales bacterium]|nr:transposase [Chitinispirillales bacterium]
MHNGFPKHTYSSSDKVCKNCEHRIECFGERSKHKKIIHGAYREQYMKNHEKRTKNARYAYRMSRLRSSTVEPVLGTLINFMSMKKVNTRGIYGVAKHVLMASLCYNLKKLIKFKTHNVESVAMAIKVQTKTEPQSGKKRSYLFLAAVHLFCAQIC